MDEILSKEQIEAARKMRTGSILCGGVGSGKSRTALFYYVVFECHGSVDRDLSTDMGTPKDLYIITTARKRDTHEWDKECSLFLLSSDRSCSISNVKVTIDSWNNIKKYQNIIDAFFIFDEQRVVGSGVWVKAFLRITKKNHWVLLSATPGDQWSDYIPVFVANGFYKNKTEFNSKHCVFSRYSKYPKIERYVGERELRRLRDSILVPIKDTRNAIRHKNQVIVEYDKNEYRVIFRDRWNPFDGCPIEESGKLLYVLRRSVNSHPNRILKVGEILKGLQRVIIFYNYNYELDILKEYLEYEGWKYAEWNGKKHEDIPYSFEKWVYLVQYSAGCEGWNCIETNSIIFYSQNYSYRIMEQAAGRIDRTNTPYRDLYYYYIRSRSPIDLSIYEALSAKRDFNKQAFIRKGF